MSTDELNKETKDIKYYLSHPNILVTVKNSVVQMVLILLSCSATYETPNLLCNNNNS